MARFGADDEEIEEFTRCLEAVRPALPSALVLLLGEFKRQTHLWDLDLRELLDFFENNGSIEFKKGNLSVGKVTSLSLKVRRSIDLLSSNRGAVERSCFMVSIPRGFSLSSVNEQLGEVIKIDQNVESNSCCVFENKTAGCQIYYLVIVSSAVL